ncbi:MAG: DegT/DnrJ/EryC1/StrS family aminotransferase, partial [Deltaproteobacteria bacterium]|nr:DegT/DnrJ/EryC1/StrS family aminotransferase [Deltaproteobacteria bacterium]
RPFDVDGARELCGKHSLWLIEDAAQAQGAKWRGRRVGTFGELATWSFYPAKNLGCFGDGGAVSGMDEELLRKVRSLANHGRAAHYHHVDVGTNSRLDALQAAVLLCRLPLLDGDNESRRRVAAAYGTALAGAAGIELLEDPDEAESVHHQFTVLCERRDELKEHLAGAGIGSAIHYPEPLHQQPALVRELGEPEPRPVAERAATEVLCLPMFPELEEAEVTAVIEATTAFVERTRGSAR